MFDVSKKDNIDRVWDIIEKASVCMLTTQFVGGLRARPLEARPDRDAGLIFFVTDIHSAKEDEIEATPDIGLVFIDSNDKAYLSITGRAHVMRDADKTKVVCVPRTSSALNNWRNRLTSAHYDRAGTIFPVPCGLATQAEVAACSRERGASTSVDRFAAQ